MSLADAPPVLVAREGPLAILTLNAPAKRNALSMAMRAMLAEAFEEIEGDAEIRAVVLTGAGGHFCSGGRSRRDGHPLPCRRARAHASQPPSGPGDGRIPRAHRVRD
ncbi:MAG: enoyl-CoA hydratase/isomerase family protein [Acetobacteraceae bacterium]|nr:enoyl-CoA hydratase/isomerase family protein [Acetobacteraceae bacterium]